MTRSLPERHFTRSAWFKGGLCVVALVGTLFLGVYQRRTGPSWPVRVDTTIAGAAVQGKLPRSHGGAGGASVDLLAASDDITGEIVWRRYPTGDPFRTLPLSRVGNRLVAELPHQPPAGKLEYSVRLHHGSQAFVFPTHETAIIRFRGDVPGWVLIPHILLMFLALTVVLRTLLGMVFADPEPERFIRWVLLLMVPGGLVMGPIVQKYAFGAYWTGWPFGDDWTDNKTLAAVLTWVAAALVAKWWARSRPAATRAAILVAIAVTVAVYLIPHSVHGSELDWETIDAESQPTSRVSSPPLTATLTRPPF